MSYIVLARKYRPQTFEDVIGQTHITDILKTALKGDRVGHAYLFCGPRGVGKTTCARILARELNKKTSQPTLEGMDLASGMDIIEVDGASNNGVDEVRALRENVQFVPMSGGKKVYIIDEVHMLSGAAFNALLKTLEEPPAHVVFVLATTDPGDLPLTVISRCQRFDFKRIPLDLMVGVLKEICVKEKFAADEDALFAVARVSQGSLRDALSILDQLSSSSSGKVSLKDVNSMLGLVETASLFELVSALSAKDCSLALKVFEGVLSQGKDEKQFATDLVQLYRDLMVMKAGEKDPKGIERLVDYSVSYKNMLLAQAQKITMSDILKALDILIRAKEDARITEAPRLALEVAFARIAYVSKAAPDSIAPSTPKPIESAPQQSVAPLTTAAPGIISNNRGSVVIGGVTPARPEIVFDSEGPVDIDALKREWDAVTQAVSLSKMSAGTCLQDGVPLGMSKGRLTIGFSLENSFHKDFLDNNELRKIVADVISAQLKTSVVVDFVVQEGLRAQAPSPALEGALEAFNGEVVNQWHNESET